MLKKKTKKQNRKELFEGWKAGALSVDLLGDHYMMLVNAQLEFLLKHLQAWLQVFCPIKSHTLNLKDKYFVIFIYIFGFTAPNCTVLVQSYNSHFLILYLIIDPWIPNAALPLIKRTWAYILLTYQKSPKLGLIIF